MSSCLKKKVEAIKKLGFFFIDIALDVSLVHGLHGPCSQIVEAEHVRGFNEFKGRSIFIVAPMNLRS